MAGALGQFVQANLVRAFVVDPEDTQLGVFHPAHGHALLVFDEVVFVVAQEGKVVFGEPAQKRPGFFLVFFADTGGGGIQFAQDFTNLVFHNREVVHGNAHFVQHRLQGFFQAPQVCRIAVAIDFQNDQCFVGGRRRLLGRMQFLQLAVTVSLHLQNRMLDGVGTDFPAVDGHAQGVDQKRNVRMQDKNNRVGRLPAVTFQVRIEYGNRGFLGAALLQKLPGRQYRAIGVREAPADKLFQGTVGVMLLCELYNLPGFGFRKLVCECFSQLLEKLILAGNCQRIHIQPLVLCERNVITVSSHKHSQALDFCRPDLKTAATTYGRKHPRRRTFKTESSEFHVVTANVR